MNQWPPSAYPSHPPAPMTHPSALSRGTGISSPNSELRNVMASSISSQQVSNGVYPPPTVWFLLPDPVTHIPLCTLMLNVQTSKQPHFLSSLGSARVGDMTPNSPSSESVYGLSTPNPWHPLKWSPSLEFPRSWWCEDTLRVPCPSFLILKLCKGLEFLYPSTCL